MNKVFSTVVGGFAAVGFATGYFIEKIWVDYISPDVYNKKYQRRVQRQMSPWGMMAGGVIGSVVGICFCVGTPIITAGFIINGL